MGGFPKMMGGFDPPPVQRQWLLDIDRCNHCRRTGGELTFFNVTDNYTVFTTYNNY